MMVKQLYKIVAGLFGYLSTVLFVAGIVLICATAYLYGGGFSGGITTAVCLIVCALLLELAQSLGGGDH